MFDYALFGQRIHSSQPLWGLAQAGPFSAAAPAIALEIARGLEAEPEVDGPNVSIFRDRNGAVRRRISLRTRSDGTHSWRVTAPALVDARVDCDPAHRTIRMLADNELAAWEFTSFLISPVMPHWVRVATANLALHATVVAIGDVAIAIAGASGDGKTTLASAFRRRGFAILADDLAVIEPATGLVHHGAPLQRIDPAQSTAVHIGRAAIGKDLIPVDDHPYWHTPRPLPLAAIFVLEGFGESDVAARLFDQTAAGFRLNAHLSRQLFKPAKAVQEAGLAAAFAVAKRVPVHALVRPRGLEHLDATVDLLSAMAENTAATTAVAG